MENGKKAPHVLPKMNIMKPILEKRDIVHNYLFTPGCVTFYFNRMQSSLGSVNGANCKELATQPDVDGFLVGGASLKVVVFLCLVSVVCLVSHLLGY